jgi:hypothetical protein
MNKFFPVSVLLSCLISVPVSAQDKSSDASQIITIETATIRGNQELPTVLYLVPWQPPKINPLPANQTAELTHQTLEKIERSSFQRLLEYHQMFKASRD